MNNEWKELKIDNLPPDILTGDYEFRYVGNTPDWHNDIRQIGILNTAWENRGAVIYQYRKPEPKAPTHAQIMGNNKYWLGDNKEWSRVTGYNPSTKQYYLYMDEHKSFPHKEWFTGRESAEIPPEA